MTSERTMTPEQRLENGCRLWWVRAEQIGSYTADILETWDEQSEDFKAEAREYITAALAPAEARIAELETEVARKDAALANPPKHTFWWPGEADCPRELKASNGELHTLRCKVCGNEDNINGICRAALNNREAP